MAGCDLRGAIDGLVDAYAAVPGVASWPTLHEGMAKRKELQERWGGTLLQTFDGAFYAIPRADAIRVAGDAVEIATQRLSDGAVHFRQARWFATLVRFMQQGALEEVGAGAAGGEQAAPDGAIGSDAAHSGVRLTVGARDPGSRPVVEMGTAMVATMTTLPPVTSMLTSDASTPATEATLACNVEVSA